MKKLKIKSLLIAMTILPMSASAQITQKEEKKEVVKVSARDSQADNVSREQVRDNDKEMITVKSREGIPLLDSEGREVKAHKIQKNKQH